MPLLVTGAFQMRIELVVQLSPQCRKDEPLYKIFSRFIIAEAFPVEKEGKL